MERFRAASLAAFVVVGLCACAASDGDGDGGGGSAGSGGSGPQGERVEGPDGSSVVVPDGAHPAPADLEVTVAAGDSPALPAETPPQGDVYAFTPHGTAFASPVTITVPFTGTAGSGLQLLTASPGGSWAPVAGARVEGNAMVAEVSHFSFFVVVLGGGEEGPMDGTWTITACTCDGVPKDLGPSPVSWTVAGTEGFVSNEVDGCALTIPLTLVYPGPGQVEWTVLRMECEPAGCMAPCGSELGQHHVATYELAGSVLTVTEERTPVGEYGCEQKRQVCTLGR